MNRDCCKRPYCFEKTSSVHFYECTMRSSTILLLSAVVVYRNVVGAEAVVADGMFRALGPVFESCENSDDMVKCFKWQAVKLLSRALKASRIKLLHGVYIVKGNETYIKQDTNTTNSHLYTSARNLDEVLYKRLDQLAQSRRLQISIPRLFQFGQQKGTALVEEGRKKMQKYLGPFVAAVLLKAAMLKMAYHSIAIVAGKALIVGKIALIISAVIGLKKLVSTEGHEKTTYEIVKHPQFQQSHTYSSSHGEYEPHESTGSSYHRSINNEEMLMQDKAYHAHAP